jgi:hypothetical protein
MGRENDDQQIRSAMISNRILGRLALVIVLSAQLLIGVSGCRRGPAMAQVRGKVFYKDGTVPQGMLAIVRFEPAADSTAEVRKGASGSIEPDGSFEMITRMPGDGVYLGKYAVTFAVQKGESGSTSLILPKYNNRTTSPYSVEVTDDIDDLKFEIEAIPGVTGAPPSATGG